MCGSWKLKAKRSKKRQRMLDERHFMKLLSMTKTSTLFTPFSRSSGTSSLAGASLLLRITRPQSYHKALAALFIGTVMMSSSAERAQAQTTETSGGDALNAEGIVGTIDKKRRSPIIIFSPKTEGDKTTLLVDALVPNEDYQQYPIQFQFFVNRRLVSTQIRSRELPGAIGIEVTPQMAVRPFNYTIVATLLHPNRQFVSVAQGAVYAQNLTSSLPCTLTLTTDGKKVEYQRTTVPLVQSGNASFTLSYKANNTIEGSRDVKGSFTFSGNTITGSLIADGEAALLVQGTLKRTGERITGFDVKDTAGTAQLSCAQDS